MDKLESMRQMSANTIAAQLGLEVTRLEPGYVEGTLPVDHRTHQPYGLLHGGASVVLAETLGSVGSHFLVADEGKLAVGVEVNCNHLRGVRSGTVTGKATLEHRGGRICCVWLLRSMRECVGMPRAQPYSAREQST
jgi:1,4-dihydroxy-2-naphthoyl-CoA hydrolase